MCSSDLKASKACLDFFVKEMPELIGGSADLTPSNNTFSESSSTFSNENPSGNHINYGVRYIEISNETAWGTNQYLKYSEQKKIARIVSIQNAYNFLNRGFEVNLSEIAIREKVGLLAYSPLASGYLSGKYRNGAMPKNSTENKINQMKLHGVQINI